MNVDNSSEQAKNTLEERILRNEQAIYQKLGSVFLCVTSLMSSSEKEHKSIVEAINGLSERLDKIERNTQKLDKLTVADDTKLTDKELYDLKYLQGISWAKLSKRVNIPTSTLQSRVRRYRQKLSKEADKL